MQLLLPGILNTFPTGGGGGNPELLPDPGIDSASNWFAPGGCTIQNSAAEWRTASAYSTLWLGPSTANMAPVSASTAYTWGVTVANFTSGGGGQAIFDWYDSGGSFISSTGAMTVTINGNGTFTANAPASPAGAAYANWKYKPTGANYNFDMTAASVKAT